MPVLKTLRMLVALTGHVSAQSNGSITGTVKDSNGGVVPAAPVTVTNPVVSIRQDCWLQLRFETFNTLNHP
jgi:hypothetical protein